MHKFNERSTRHTILHLIKKNGSMSVNDLALHIGITEMAVRRHVNTLERDGYVEAKLTRQGLGRPAQVYSLTDTAADFFPKNYHMLALDLLGELQDEDGVTAEQLFRRREEKLARKYADYMEDQSLRDKVVTLADLQNKAGYMAEWEEAEDGYILNEFNCPISQVAFQYQQACSCELSLFQRLLQADVERTECLASGGNKCTYKIRTSSELY